MSDPHGDVHERFARMSIELGRTARAAGNHPFGAPLVLDGAVVVTPEHRPHRLSVIGPLLLEEARDVHLGYWSPGAVTTSS